MKRNTESRFWAKVRKGPSCWVWTAGTAKSGGYGLFWNIDRMVRAHRFSWELTNGPILDDLWVLHDCDNPPCVRPDHLYLGGPSENLRDAYSRGQKIATTQAAITATKAKTHCHNRHPYNEKNTYWGRNGRRGERIRMCRRCAARRVKRWRERKQQDELVDSMEVTV